MLNISNNVITSWLKKAKIFDEYTYLLIVAIVTIVITGHYATKNLANSEHLKVILLYLFFFLVLFLAPLWYQYLSSPFALFHKKIITKEKRKNFNNSETKEQLINKYLEKNTAPLNPLQFWAVVFLGCFILFESFIVNGWIENFTIIWLPNWLSDFINFLISFDPLNWFVNPSSLSLHNIDESDLIYSPYGECIILLQLYRVIMLAPVLASIIILISKKTTQGNSILSILDFIAIFSISMLCLILLFGNPALIIPPNQDLTEYSFGPEHNNKRFIIWLETLGINVIISLIIFIMIKIFCDFFQEKEKC